MSSRHSLLSKPIEALMRVISASGPLPNRPPQVRCGSRFAGGLSDIGARGCLCREGGHNHPSFGKGAPQRIGTWGLCLRRAALYPAELRVREGRLALVARVRQAVTRGIGRFTL